MNVTGRDSRPIPDGKGGYFIERINPGAFQKALQRAEKVNILFNHNWNRKIGDTSSNLKLKEDVIGLRAHAEITDEEVIKEAKANRLRGWSFDIKNPVDYRAEREGKLPLRTISDFEISEVSLISNMKPWYNSTTVEARAENSTVEIRAEEFEAERYGFDDNKINKNKKELKQIIENLGGFNKE